MTETTKTPEDLTWTQHRDPRVEALLRLAAWTVDRHEDAEHYNVAGIAASIVPHVPYDLATTTFDMIYADAHDAHDYDTRGADAVTERFGRWDETVGLTGDEKASEERDRLYLSARTNAEMLVTLEDSRRR